MTIKTTDEERNTDMAREDEPTAKEIDVLIETVIQELVRDGLVVDSGQRIWCQDTGRYEIVWENTMFGKTFH